MHTASPDITIRPLTRADAPAYRTIRLAALAETPSAFGASYEDEAARPLEAIVERLEGPAPNRIFGAVAGSDLVGMAGFVMPDRSVKGRHAGRLVGVHVAPAHRERRLGHTLVEAVIAYARGQVVVLRAAVGADNGPARHLYAGLGFVEYGLERRALLVEGRFVDEVLIALDLDRT